MSSLKLRAENMQFYLSRRISSPTQLIAEEVAEITVLMQMKKFAEAEAELHRAIELSDNSSLAHLYRGRVLVSLQKYGEAEKELQRVISLGGVHMQMAYRYLGALFNEIGDKPRAIESLEKYLTLLPKAKDTDEVREIIKQLRSESGNPEK